MGTQNSHAYAHLCAYKCVLTRTTLYLCSPTQYSQGTVFTPTRSLYHQSIHPSVPLLSHETSYPGIYPFVHTCQQGNLPRSMLTYICTYCTVANEVWIRTLIHTLIARPTLCPHVHARLAVVPCKISCERVVERT